MATNIRVPVLHENDGRLAVIDDVRDFLHQRERKQNVSVLEAMSRIIKLHALGEQV